MIIIKSRSKLLQQLSNLVRTRRGVFGQQLDPLVFQNHSKFATKKAKMTVNELAEP